MHWWPMQTPNTGSSGPSSAMTCSAIPLSSGRPVAILGFAFTEAIALVALMMAYLMLFVF